MLTKLKSFWRRIVAARNEIAIALLARTGTNIHKANIPEVNRPALVRVREDEYSLTEKPLVSETIESSKETKSIGTKEKLSDSMNRALDVRSGSLGKSGPGARAKNAARKGVAHAWTTNNYKHRRPLQANRLS